MSIAEGRNRLSAVLRKAGHLITVDDATEVLQVDRTAAAKTLARWQAQGWLKRVRRGLYAPVPLTSSPSDQVLEDPWTLVVEVFDPGYVGGASAAHHWDLTEQLFRSVFIYTVRPVRWAHQTIQGIPFVVRHITPEKMFGVRPLWRGRVKLQISDVHRTLIDLLDDPATGGGIRHVAECLRAYWASSDADPPTLIAYADRIGNGAIFKRLGYLAERDHATPEVIAACAERLTQGNIKLDPALTSPRLIRKWRLWLPDRWKREPRDD
ncbi:MAG: type IV toxin-antitoxin system AbiEi family antitoxin domain-containing protein [Gammaproteobacteria bacterium]